MNKDKELKRIERAFVYLPCKLNLKKKKKKKMEKKSD